MSNVSERMARGRDIGVLRRWILDLEVDVYAKGVLHVLAQYVAAPGGDAWPSVERIARESGMSLRKARATLRDLREVHKVIAPGTSRGKVTNTYRLLCPAFESSDTNRARGAPLRDEDGGELVDLNGARRARMSSAQDARLSGQPCIGGPSTVHSVPPIVRMDLPTEAATSRESTATPAPSVWDVGVGLLGEQSRSLFGRLIREHGEIAVAKAVAETAASRPADPRSYLLGILRKRRPQASDRVMSSPI
ncbi:MAG: helix-turn-helix domain-containing protein [Gammaproteobacteria bacterium]